MLEAASGLFGTSGYDAVQMDDVARAAGVGKPTLYRYFGSKEELFLEVLGEVLQQLELRLEEVAARPLPPPESLALMMRTLVDTLARHTEPLRLIAGDNPGLAHRLRAAFRNRRRPILEVLRQVLERGMANGDFRRLDLEVTPALLARHDPGRPDQRAGRRARAAGRGRDRPRAPRRPGGTDRSCLTPGGPASGRSAREDWTGSEKTARHRTRHDPIGVANP